MFVIILQVYTKKTILGGVSGRVPREVPAGAKGDG